MKYLHALKPPILHRDISAGNVFLHPTVDGKACIGDFGIAITKVRRGSIKYSQNGNPRYRAPEVSNGEPYSRKASPPPLPSLLLLSPLLTPFCLFRRMFTVLEIFSTNC